jgi:hypothetical protein
MGYEKVPKGGNGTAVNDSHLAEWCVLVRFRETGMFLDEEGVMTKNWRCRSAAYVKARPGVAIVGAFAIGYLLAKVARHA